MDEDVAVSELRTLRDTMTRDISRNVTSSHSNNPDRYSSGRTLFYKPVFGACLCAAVVVYALVMSLPKHASDRKNLSYDTDFDDPLFQPFG
jgi:type VI protein secretion system component VasF